MIPFGNGSKQSDILIDQSSVVVKARVLGTRRSKSLLNLTAVAKVSAMFLSFEMGGLVNGVKQKAFDLLFITMSRH
jgi:hypothetical protein